MCCGLMESLLADWPKLAWTSYAKASQRIQWDVPHLPCLQRQWELCYLDTKTDTRSCKHNHLDIYMHALRSSIDTERFASPLNCSAPLCNTPTSVKHQYYC